jgi:glycerol-3-phosphate dehydrogenase
MTRDLAQLASRPFDLLIVGAGVYGAALAYEASRQGYSVAVVDRGDFAGGSSSNSLKILHGGLRYLQQLNLPRMRSSIRARRGWAQLAPNFVTPLACAIATKGLGSRSMAALSAALLANELVSFDRNHGIGEANRLPPARLVSSNEYAALTDGLCTTVNTPGAMWWDALALDTERLVLELLARAADNGAVLANYVEVKSLRIDAGVVQGAVVADVESADEIQIRAQRVVCTGNAISAGFMAAAPGLRHIATRPRCHALNIIVDRMLPTRTALALSAPSAGAKATKGDLFFVPWRDRTMVGTHYAMADGAELTPERRRQRVGEFLQLIRAAAPQWSIGTADITFVHWGDLPVDSRWRPGEPIRLSPHVEIVDGGTAEAAGLWLMSGPKFTTALESASTSLRRMVKGLEPALRPADESGRARSPFTEGLARMDKERTMDGKAELAAKFLHARRLEDVVLRRTGCGSGGYPGRAALEACANGMARALQWSEAREATEIAAVEQQYRERHFWDPPEAQSAAKEFSRAVAFRSQAYVP